MFKNSDLRNWQCENIIEKLKIDKNNKKIDSFQTHYLKSKN